MSQQLDLLILQSVFCSASYDDMATEIASDNFLYSHLASRRLAPAGLMVLFEVGAYPPQHGFEAVEVAKFGVAVAGSHPVLGSCHRSGRSLAVAYVSSTRSCLS